MGCRMGRILYCSALLFFYFGNRAQKSESLRLPCLSDCGLRLPRHHRRHVAPLLGRIPFDSRLLRHMQYVHGKKAITFALIQDNGLLRESSSPPYIIIIYVTLWIFIAIHLFFEGVPKYERPSFCGFCPRRRK